ncbi:beta-galactosidase [Chloroflexus sp. Y-396-1]|uniref:beta-galactosidase n=1 Tax=Chloroflexus sp. Y-396-1 TaxID=867845 RepID=UPI00048EE916|nr:beta-galactosidase [Chloroflexus sp. Y-396-1]
MNRTVRVTRNGIELDGRPWYLLAGCIHYMRWPRAEWRPLLEQARWAGLNTIDTVIPWNRHEPQPGEFDFSDEADLGAFLDLCHELGLKVIVRPGPYICAEWENGGLPAWLTASGHVRLRTDDPAFRDAVLRWFDVLMPILVPRQYTRGGPIILCQIENEHWASGVYGADGHQQTLAQAALERGIDVPQYTCMGAMPNYPEFRNGWSGIAEKLVQTRQLWPDNPMIVSELWSGWFDNWGGVRQSRKTAAKLDMTLHQLTAVGCAGFSHWMWAGGTNFGFWGGRTVGGDLIHMTTSYDYDAPVDEYGRLTAKALVARRHHLFLSCFGAELSAVLADAAPGGMTVIAPPAIAGRSEGGAQPYRTVRAASTAPPAWRDFCATFLSNPGLEAATYEVFLPSGDHLSVEVEPTSIRPIFANLPLGESGISVVAHTGRILGYWPDQGTLVIYGREGEQGKLILRLPEPPVGIHAADAGLTARVQMREQTLQIDYWITAEGRRIEVAWEDHALLIELLPQTLAERYGSQPLPPPQPSRRTTLPTRAFAVVEATTDSGWQPIPTPVPLEQLGCPYGYGWYRAELELATPLNTTLAAPELNDRALVLVNGEFVGVLGLHPNGPRYTLPLSLPAGHHDLRLLVDNLGRFDYGLGLGERKGLLAPLYLDGSQTDISDGWAAYWQEVQFAGEAVANIKPWVARPDATAVHLGRFAWTGPMVWLIRPLEVVAGKRYRVHITGDRNSGAFFVNGIAFERFSRHRSGGFISADITHLLQPGTNTLALQILNYAGAPWRAILISYDGDRPLPARWSFRAGVTVSEQPAPPAGPAFVQAVFNRNDLPSTIQRLALRPGTLDKGQIWLNGQNCGRFWQIGPQEEYKLPISWLNVHNELLLFVEQARTGTVDLVYEEKA